MANRMKALVVALLALLPLGAHAADAPKLLIATGVDPGFAQFYVALQAGLFKKEGLDVELKTGPAGGAMVPLVIGNQANAAMSAVFAGLVNHLVDPNLVAVAQTNTYDHWYGIVTRSDITSIQALKGRKLGITRGTASEALWLAALKKAQLEPPYAEAVYIDPPEMLAAMERHDIDGFSNWEPWITRTLLAVPNTHLLMDNYGVLPDEAMIYMNRTWIEQNHAAAVKFLRAIVEATAYVKTKPAQAKKLMEGFLHLPPQQMDAMLPKLTFTAKLDDETYEITKIQVDLLRQRGRLKGDFDYARWFYPDLLKEVDPSRVKLPAQM
ncbi:MAG TPA: ABC transporter substrate-binding protein [Candidatus Sulfotelmatobacter sp.]|nr:ABC transporter substrate-binding protein [Candidatus Sulfotelmatobacter sp.]